MALSGPNNCLPSLWGGYQGEKGRIFTAMAGERPRDIGHKLKQDTQSGYKEKSFASKDSESGCPESCAVPIPGVFNI